MAEFRPLPSHYKQCFGCGEEHPTGLHMSVETDGEEIRASFVVTEHHQGAPGLAHGGVIASALDEAMGFLIWLIARPAVTGHIEVDYRKPVPMGTTLELSARVDKIEGRKIFASVKGTVDGVVHVEGHSLFIEVGVEHFKSGIERVGESWIRPYNP